MNTAAIIGLILVAVLLLLMLFRRDRGSDGGPDMTGPRDVDGGRGG